MMPLKGRQPSSTPFCRKYEERIFTCHGGAIETPADFERLLDLESRFDGYVGGSSAERFPVEDAVPKAAQGFKSVRLRK